MSLQPLRIAYIKDHLGDTGGTYYLRDLLRNINRDAIDPVVCALRPSHQAAGYFQETGITPHIFARGKWDPRAVLDIQRIIETKRINLLHIEGQKTFFAARLAARRSRTPVLMHFHNMLDMPKPLAFAQRQLTSSRHYGIAISKSVQHWAQRQFALPEDRLETVYNFIDLDRFKPQPEHLRTKTRRGLGIHHDDFAIGLIGRIDARIKGQLEFLSMLNQYCSTYPRLKTVIAGGGPDLQRCRDFAAQLGLQQQVIFTGHCDDITRIMCAVDVIAIPSLVAEGMTLVALEAAAMARPVIAFANGGLREAVRDQETGYLITSGDWPGFAHAICKLSCDPAVCQAMGVAGLDFSKQFSKKVHISRIMDIYTELMDRRPN